MKSMSWYLVFKGFGRGAICLGQIHDEMAVVERLIGLGYSVGSIYPRV